MYKTIKGYNCEILKQKTINKNYKEHNKNKNKKLKANKEMKAIKTFIFISKIIDFCYFA